MLLLSFNQSNVSVIILVFTSSSHEATQGAGREGKDLRAWSPHLQVGRQHLGPRGCKSHFTRHFGANRLKIEPLANILWPFEFLRWPVTWLLTRFVPRIERRNCGNNSSLSKQTTLTRNHNWRAMLRTKKINTTCLPLLLSLLLLLSLTPFLSPQLCTNTAVHCRKDL